MRQVRGAGTALIVSGALVLQGCAAMTTAYHPRVTNANQSLKFAQGVGTLAETNADHELFMYPTFKLQGSGQPTFTIGYANNGTQDQNFSVENVKAFYRGAPVPLYTYAEKIEEIRQEKLGKQIALAILGGIAAGAAANAASKQTYTSNYSGAVGNRYGVTRFYGSNTIRVYDPASGIIAGAAVAGATGVGIGQIEYNAINQEAAAEAILQANTVGPQRMVSGQLILKGCCDRESSGNDMIRFEVTANGKTSAFEFLRLAGNVAPPPQAMSAPAPGPAPAAVQAVSVAYATGVVAATSQPVPRNDGIVASATAAPPPSSGRVAAPSSKDAFQAERLPEARACNVQPRAILSAKGAGFESYTLACSNGDSLSIRCEFGNCRVLR